MSDVNKAFQIHNKAVCTVTTTLQILLRNSSVLKWMLILKQYTQTSSAWMQVKGNDSKPDSAFTAATESSDEDEEMDPVPIRWGWSLSLSSQTLHCSHCESTGQRYWKMLQNNAKVGFYKSNCSVEQGKAESKGFWYCGEKAGLWFVVPNDTRWNSVFLPMKLLSHIAARTAKAEVNVDEATSSNVATPQHDDVILHTVSDKFGFCSSFNQRINFLAVTWPTIASNHRAPLFLIIERSYCPLCCQDWS